jgi:hypothetical protein
LSSFKPFTKDSHPELWAKAERLRLRLKAKDPVQVCDSEEWGALQKELMRKRQDVLTGQGRLFG